MKASYKATSSQISIREGAQIFEAREPLKKVLLEQFSGPVDSGKLGC